MSFIFPSNSTAFSTIYSGFSGSWFVYNMLFYSRNMYVYDDDDDYIDFFSENYHRKWLKVMKNDSKLFECHQYVGMQYTNYLKCTHLPKLIDIKIFRCYDEIEFSFQLLCRRLFLLKSNGKQLTAMKGFCGSWHSWKRIIFKLMIKFLFKC